MGRKTTFAWVRAGLLAAAWLVGAVVVEGVAGSDLGGSVQQLGERLELHLRDKGDKSSPAAQPPPSPPPRERSRPDAIQPWEPVVA